MYVLSEYRVDTTCELLVNYIMINAGAIVKGISKIQYLRLGKDVVCATVWVEWHNFLVAPNAIYRWYLSNYRW
jgi:hypothetical protein